jgi:protein required for attachment to host cells/predicted transcriptional regulator
MTRGVRTLSPHDSIAAAAQAMEALDVGVVPVCEQDLLVGIVTDRDIVVRGVARGRPPEATPLNEVMSREPRWCFDDQSLDEVLEQMRDARIRRVPVLDRAQHLVGMLSLGDVAVKADGDGAGIVLQEVSEPAQPEAAPVTGANDRSAAADDDRRPASDDDRSAGAGDDGRTDDGRWADKGVVPRTDAKTIWVLVADEAIARILRWPEQGDTLESVEELTDPAAHAKEGDFNRDAQGRRAGVAPHGSRQNTPHRLRGTSSVTASAGEEDRHLEAQGFARRVAERLAEALRAKRFDELRIVAAPRFLGHLRKELDSHVEATVSQQINKDLVHAENSELTRRLFPERAGDAAGR